jgi:uncharacterized phage infection (PIP) family protein YhgE
LNEQIATSEETLTNEINQAQENLKVLQERVLNCQTQATNLADELKTQLTEVESEIDQQNSELESAAESYGEQLSQLSEQVQELTNDIENELETVKGDLGEFKEIVETAKSSFEEQKVRLLQEYDNLESEIKSQLESIMNAFDNLMEEGETKLTALENILDTTSSEVITGINQKYTQEIFGELTKASTELTNAISFLEETSESATNIFDGKLGEVIDQVGEITGIIEKIKPVLDLVETLL